MVDPFTLAAGAYGAYTAADKMGVFGGNDDGNPLDDRVNEARWMGALQAGQARHNLGEQGHIDPNASQIGGVVENPAFADWQQRYAVQKNTFASQGMSDTEAAAAASRNMGAPPQQTALAADVWSDQNWGLGSQSMNRADNLDADGTHIARDIGGGLVQAGNKQSAQAERWMGRADGLQESAMRTRIPTVGYRPESAGRNAGDIRSLGQMYTQQYEDGTDPSAAQAQLQAGTDQAIRSQMSMARSSGSPLAMYSAQNNAATLQQQRANSAAQLRAQEQQTLRGAIAQQQGMAGQEFRAMDAQRADIERSNIDSQNAYRFGMLDRSAQAADVGQGLYGTANQTYGAGMAGYGMEMAYRSQANQDRDVAQGFYSRALGLQQDQAEWERKKRTMAANAATGGAAMGSTQAFQSGMYETQRADQREDAGTAMFGQLLTGLASSNKG